MPKIKFLQDFQGKETREVFYKEGQEVELDDSLTSVLVKEGRAALVQAVTPTHYGAQVTEELEPRDDKVIYNEFVKEAIHLVEETPPDPEPEPKAKKRGKK